MKILIQNVTVVNEGRSVLGHLLINGMFIEKIYTGQHEEILKQVQDDGGGVKVDQVIDATGLWLLPGAIDDQVHFREPGLTHKGNIQSESKAAVAGGVTSFMDMPNTNPQTTNLDNLEWKFQQAQENSYANYSFFFGATNDNQHLIQKLDKTKVPGVKIFMAASTGNMLVNDTEILTQFFQNNDILFAVHAEDEMIIQNNVKYFTQKYGQDQLDASFHPLIRSEEACYQATALITELANRSNTRLHLLHISTQKEVQLLKQNVNITLDKKKITAETCVHFLWFTDQDYKTLGNKIKWNPAVKTLQDRNALRDAVNNNVIDIVATDHAPHLIEEKQGNCITAASGAPMVQHSLVAMLELAKQGVFTKEKVVETMAHRPAQLFRIDRRGFIRPGYYADLVLVDPNQTWTVNKHNLLYHCQWSPLENQTFSCKIIKTFVNGTLTYDQGNFNNFPNPLPLKFSASQ